MPGFLLKFIRHAADIPCMAAAPGSGVTASELSSISPELVLVDPDLAAPARALLPEPLDTVAAMSPAARKRRILPVRYPDDGSLPLGALSAHEARRRLLANAVDSEILGSLLPSRRRLHRATTLVPTSSAATGVALLVLQLYLGHGSLG